VNEYKEKEGKPYTRYCAPDHFFRSLFAASVPDLSELRK
jgi:hypothetical protein